MDRQEQLGKKIAALRKESGMTQRELGEELNISYQAVSKWERGESYPDFDTISRMAKIFGVKLSYFESEAEVGDAVAEEEAEKEDKPIGVCKACGRMITAAQAYTQTPYIKCKDCHAREEKEKARVKEEQEKKKRYKEAWEREAVSKLLTKSFIWAGIASALILVIGIVTACSVNGAGLYGVIGGIVTAAFGFFFVAQLFWDGAVIDVAACGGKVIGEPGVIFTFDLDGFIFLIAIKILFAVLRFIIWLATIIFFGLIAALISPITFFPALKRVKTEGTCDTIYIDPADKPKTVYNNADY